jgi:hypothetical protein
MEHRNRHVLAHVVVPKSWAKTTGCGAGRTEMLTRITSLRRSVRNVNMVASACTQRVRARNIVPGGGVSAQPQSRERQQATPTTAPPAAIRTSYFGRSLGRGDSRLSALVPLAKSRTAAS